MSKLAIPDEGVMTPTPEQVKALRESVQTDRGIGITAAQDVCAAAVHTSRRSWQQWEAGDRRMHAAFWELARLKLTATPQLPSAQPGE